MGSHLADSPILACLDLWSDLWDSGTDPISRIRLQHAFLHLYRARGLLSMSLALQIRNIRSPFNDSWSGHNAQ